MSIEYKCDRCGHTERTKEAIEEHLKLHTAAKKAGFKVTYSTVEADKQMPEKRSSEKLPHSISWWYFPLGLIVSDFVLSIIAAIIQAYVYSVNAAESGYYLVYFLVLFLWIVYFSFLLYNEDKGAGKPNRIGFYIGCLGLIIGLIEHEIWKPKESEKLPVETESEHVNSKEELETTKKEVRSREKHPQKKSKRIVKSEGKG